MSRWHQRRHGRARRWRPEEAFRPPMTANLRALLDVIVPAAAQAMHDDWKFAEARHQAMYRIIDARWLPVHWTNPAVRDMLDEAPEGEVDR